MQMHDAILKHIAVDFVDMSVRIDLDCYENEKATKKTAKSIHFEGVKSVSQIVDMAELSRHTFAGHANYWSHDRKSGTTFIYLATGWLEIRAKKMSVKTRKTSRTS